MEAFFNSPGIYLIIGGGLEYLQYLPNPHPILLAGDEHLYKPGGPSYFYDAPDIKSVETYLDFLHRRAMSVPVVVFAPQGHIPLKVVYAMTAIFDAEAGVVLKHRNLNEGGIREMGLRSVESENPKRFRKKPVVVSAMQFISPPSLALKQWLGDSMGVTRVNPNGVTELEIRTLEDGHDGRAIHVASEGDWIIKEVDGEFYPCKPDIFDITYESA